MIPQDDVVAVRMPLGVTDMQPPWPWVVDWLNDELVEIEMLDKLYRLPPVVECREQDVRCLATYVLRAPYPTDSVVDTPRAVAGSDVDSTKMVPHGFEDVFTECTQCFNLCLARCVVQSALRGLARPCELYQTEVRRQIGVG